jgi:hypothetical protein
MHKGQKLTLQPMTPAEIIQAEKERLAIPDDDAKPDAKIESPAEIRLKNLLCLQPSLIFMILMLLTCVMC